MLIGLLIGIGMILPGISGGVLAVIFGVYEKIIKSLGNFSKSFSSITPAGEARNSDLSQTARPVLESPKSTAIIFIRQISFRLPWLY